MALEIAKHAFTVNEFNQMAEAGILSEDDRVELIEICISWRVCSVVDPRRSPIWCR